MKESTRDRGIQIFKYFIDFLKIWGQENYGENVEINWPAVFKFTNSFHILDFREDLEELVFTEDDDEFRDKVFTWIENQILSGYPVWRLFMLSGWLNDKLEHEFTDAQINKDIQYFNIIKCYRCKKFSDHVHFIGSDKFSHSYSTDRDKYVKGYPLLHNMCCVKRCELIDEIKVKRGHPMILHEECIEFDYELFNLDSKTQFGSKWKLNPEEHDKCPYFEESEMTYKQFIDTYGEILR